MAMAMQNASKLVTQFGKASHFQGFELENL